MFAMKTSGVFISAAARLVDIRAQFARFAARVSRLEDGSTLLELERGNVTVPPVPPHDAPLDEWGAHGARL